MAISSVHSSWLPADQPWPQLFLVLEFPLGSGLAPHVAPGHLVDLCLGATSLFPQQFPLMSPTGTVSYFLYPPCPCIPMLRTGFILTLSPPRILYGKLYKGFSAFSFPAHPNNPLLEVLPSQTPRHSRLLPPHFFHTLHQAGRGSPKSGEEVTQGRSVCWQVFENMTHFADF